MNDYAMTLSDMTPDQVREAAIELCRAQGIDPFHRTPYGRIVPGLEVEEWEHRAAVVRSWLEIMRAVNKVARRYDNNDQGEPRT